MPKGNKYEIGSGDYLFSEAIWTHWSNLFLTDTWIVLISESYFEDANW